MLETTVKFDFYLEDIVENNLGGVGVVTMLGIDSSGCKCYVQDKSGNGGWWAQNLLRKAHNISQFERKG